MSNTDITVQKYIRNGSIQKRINDLLRDRASQFTTSLLSLVNANTQLANCKPETVLNAALTAASLDLPINQNLGFAAIVPYKDEAQFQIMWKGFVQLAQRSGKYKTISATPVYEGQLVGEDPLKGFVWDWSQPAKGEPIGYAAYFELLNGFEKTLYMTTKQVEEHAKKYSKAYAYDLKAKKKSSPWSTNFDAMAEKTVLKLLISKFGSMSTTMEKALESDQAIITDKEVKYVDNDLTDVGADDDKKAAIIAAHGKAEPKDKTEEGESDTATSDSSG